MNLEAMSDEELINRYHKKNGQLTKLMWADKDKAQNIIDIMFKRFSKGKKWIDKTHKMAEEELRIVSKLGVVRHLYGHLSNQDALRASMNRRGPNSSIQGTSSNVANIGARELQKINFQLKQYGIDMKFKHTNFVHDSIKASNGLKMLPLSLYYLEHALTTQTYKFVKEVFNWDMLIHLELAFELGGNSARNQKWDFTYLHLLQIVRDEIDWMKADLKYDLDKDEIVKAIKNNWRVVWPYREKELAGMSGYKSSDVMLLTPKIAAKKEWIQ